MNRLERLHKKEVEKSIEESELFKRGLERAEQCLPEYDGNTVRAAFNGAESVTEPGALRGALTFKIMKELRRKEVGTNG